VYLRTPALQKPGSVWPTQAGTAVSNDVWMLGIGLGLVAGSLGQRRRLIPSNAWCPPLAR